MSDVEICTRCGQSGEIALKTSNLRYVGPGPVPDDARGICSVTCDRCGGIGMIEVIEIDEAAPSKVEDQTNVEGK